jgi:UDP-glucuronate 4-epimerase
MRILVTGGAGFIGSHLCRRLLKDGHEVFCLDNFCDFYNPEIKRNNIKDFQFDPNFTLLEGDIRDRDTLISDFQKYDYDQVIHLAAMAGVRPSIINPDLYTHVNINGTVNLLDCCRNHGIKHFIFASSSSVYGNNEKVPFNEEDRVDNPISPYAATKKAGELLCHTYHHLFGISIACLRFFTVYGPGQRPDLAIHKFSKLILEDKPITVFGDGSTRRDYTFIDDIIDGITKAHDYIQKNNACEIFNLGESQTISLSEMISGIEDALGKKANKVTMPMQPGDVEQTFADICKSKKLLHYNPQTKFNEGIKIFAQWVKDYYKK